MESGPGGSECQAGACLYCTAFSYGEYYQKVLISLPSGRLLAKRGLFFSPRTFLWGLFPENSAFLYQAEDSTGVQVLFTILIVARGS